MSTFDSPPFKKRRVSSSSIALSTSSMSSLFNDTNDTASTQSFSTNVKPMGTDVDTGAYQASVEIRRRIKRAVFNDIDIDWRSIPAVFDDGYKLHVLSRIPHLRCKSGHEYLATILDEFRLQTPEVAANTTSNSETIVIDDDEMVDMIG